jgi:RNA polymerase-binding protein DksA
VVKLLKKEELAEIRKGLMAERERLLADAAHMDRSIHSAWILGREAVDSSVTSNDETASAAMAFQLAEALGSVERQILVDIEDALRRMEAGTYGKCVDCGEAIAFGRLKAKPHARLCIACREALDRQRS